MKKKVLITTVLTIAATVVIGSFSGCGIARKDPQVQQEPQQQEQTEQHQHVWVDATCTAPKTCSVCGQTEGEPLGHSIDEWEVVKEATCTEEGLQKGVCSLCGEELTEPIPMTDHVPGKWEVSKKAKLNKSGEKVQKCVNCGEVLNTKSYDLSEKQKKKLYKKSCKSISYEKLARNPEKYEGKLVKFTGKVVQVQESDSLLYYSTYRINVTQDGWGYWDDTVYVNYDSSGSETRVLEDDIVTFYGEYQGLMTYETIFGANITIPHVIAEYMEIN